MAKISANKLAEFLVTANSSRRRKIIYDQKHPSTAVVARYRAAAEPISQYLTNGRTDPTPIDAAVVRLRTDRSGSDWAIDDRQGTADALEEFLALAVDLPLEEVTVLAAPIEATKLNVNGVSISVRPDYMLSFSRKGRTYSGAIKLHFVKSVDSALTKKGAEFVSVLLHEWLTQFGPRGSLVSHGHCLSIDVFRRSIVSAPRATTRRWSEIEAACEEVGLRWPTL